MNNLDAIFEELQKFLELSECNKRAVICGTYPKLPATSTAKPAMMKAWNVCYGASGDECPRVERKLPSGEGYDLCDSRHAEERLAANMLQLGLESDGAAYLLGHEYSCEVCKDALRSIGVKVVYIRANMESDISAEQL